MAYGESKTENAIEAEDLGVEPAYVPEGWESAEKFLCYVVETYNADILFDQKNRQMALEDLQFAAGDQWDPDVKKRREDKFRPCMTINVLPQFVGQVIGDRRMNKTTIKVRPLKDGTQEIAEIRSGLIKSIELFSRAERAYDAACEDQVTCGMGALRVDLDYAANDVFDQDIFIRHVPNPLACVWDRMSVDPTGRDARHVFVTDTIPTEIYEKEFPDQPYPTGLSDTASLPTAYGEWRSDKTVRITEFWEIIEKPATFALMANGAVEDVTDIPFEEYAARLWVDENNFPRIRESYRTYARMHLVTGWGILSEAYEVPLTRLPIVRVEGRVIRVGEERVRFGLVRYSKDSQRLKNYWRSVAAETLALAPKAQWIASDESVKGREQQFREAHLSGDPLLIYNDKAEAPDRVDPPAVPAALLQEAQLNQQDIKDTTGLQDASLGIRSNEVSGRAIDARRRAGDVATAVYHDNLNHAIMEVGDIVNQLIPLAYDTVRTIRVIGEDDKHKLMVINDTPENDITFGKYDVTLETGPSFATQRAEALDAMMTLVQTSPELMGVIGDLVAKYMDWPGAVEIAERLKKTIPKELLNEEDQPEPSPEEQQAMMQQQQQAEQAQAMQMRMAEIELQQAEAALAKAEAEALRAQAEQAQAEADVKTADARARQADALALKAEIDASFAEEMNNEKLAASKRAAAAPSPTKAPAPKKAQPKGKVR